MKKILLGIIVLLISGLIILNLLQHSTNNNSDSKTIKIGVILPLTGNNAKLGEEGRQGVEFAIKKIHPKKKFEFIFEDDQKNPAKTVSAVNKLILQDKVDLIINYSSQSSAIVAPIVTQHEILQFAFSSDSSFTRNEGNYAYATPISTDAQVLLKHIKKQGYKRIAMISEIDGYFPLVGKSIEYQAQDFDTEIVFSAEVNPTDRDFKTIIAKAEMQKPDIYILQAWMPIVNILTKQVRDVQKDIPLTSTYSFGLVDDLTPFEGQYFVNFGYDNKGFDEDFHKAFGRNPGLMSAVFYSMTTFAVDTLDNIDDYHNTQELRKTMEKIISKDDSLLKGMSLQENTIAFPSVLVQIKNGKEELVKE